MFELSICEDDIDIVGNNEQAISADVLHWFSVPICRFFRFFNLKVYVRRNLIHYQILSDKISTALFWHSTIVARRAIQTSAVL